jgi:hypothetical protein
VRLLRSGPLVAATLALALGAIGCEGNPDTTVVIANEFSSSHTPPFVVYRVRWQALWLDASVAPGSSSQPESTYPASANTAYVLVAPGWSPASDAAPTALFVMQSRDGFAVALNDSLQIPVNDGAFMGDCAARSFLSQDQADFITQVVFHDEFAGLRYDAATCTTTPIGRAGSR